MIKSTQKFLLVEFIQYVVRDRSHDSLSWNKRSNYVALFWDVCFGLVVLVNCEIV